MILFETGQFDLDLCRQSDVLVRAQFDAHARLFSFVLGCVDFPEHRQSTLTRVPSQVSDHFAQVSSS